MLTPEQEAEWFGAESFEGETLNDWMMLPNSCGNNDCGDGHCPQCGSCRDWADDEDDDGNFMYYCGSCSHKFYAETFEAEIPQSVKYGFGFGAGMALFQVAVIGTAMILGARRQ